MGVVMEKKNQVILNAFLSSADFFFHIKIFGKFFQDAIRVSNSLYPDQARPFVGPDLGPNCLQRLSADDTIWQRVKEGQKFCSRGHIQAHNIIT